MTASVVEFDALVQVKKLIEKHDRLRAALGELLKAHAALYQIVEGAAADPLHDAAANNAAAALGHWVPITQNTDYAHRLVHGRLPTAPPSAQRLVVARRLLVKLLDEHTDEMQAIIDLLDGKGDQE